MKFIPSELRKPFVDCPLTCNIISANSWENILLFEDSDSLNNVWFSDECHIHLNGCINRQTTRFHGFGRLDVMAQKLLYSAHVAIWCAISANGYFVEDEEGSGLLPSPRTLQEFSNRTIPSGFERFCRARNIQMNRQWYQQDGATRHTTRESLAMLQENFPGRIISCGTDFTYPSHSPDLTPSDAYLWEMLKQSAFNCNDPLITVPALHEKIISFCRSL
ncbi:hypothetical protein HNY73_004699 [Argiope bruennichi]|uniref:Transposable element Tc3 transposase n=1 Tax=Argiope bruennichi TaxID=94029 RepID=A0A8T0FWK7_ARGBR|nr:hypothetical protein HNY73_004699 [Argiope bruennichi]